MKDSCIAIAGEARLTVRLYDNFKEVPTQGQTSNGSKKPAVPKFTLTVEYKINET